MSFELTELAHSSVCLPICALFMLSRVVVMLIVIALTLVWDPPYDKDVKLLVALNLFMITVYFISKLHLITKVIIQLKGNQQRSIFR